jgi:hypothetical protein
MNLPSYPKVWNLGHPYVKDLLLDPVIVQEKIDGSQFSFGIVNGRLEFRSHRVEIDREDPGMFKLGVEAIMLLSGSLRPGWIYRGEFLAKPKHNGLTYDRVPEKHVILFDITVGPETYLNPAELLVEAHRLGLEVTPCLASYVSGETLDLDMLQHLLTLHSKLGNVPIEGVVIKNYHRFSTQDGKALMGKYVSPAFREIQKGGWKDRNPTRGDILTDLTLRLTTEARWVKAVQRRLEANTLEFAPQDIGPLIKRVQKDVEDECVAEIQEALFKWAWPQLKRKVTAGLPEWYKQLLLLRQFEDSTGCDPSDPPAPIVPTPDERPAGFSLDAPYPWARDDNPDVLEPPVDLPPSDGSEPDCEIS